MRQFETPVPALLIVYAGKQELNLAGTFHHFTQTTVQKVRGSKRGRDIANAKLS